jgi:hypothetical protein
MAIVLPTVVEDALAKVATATTLDRVIARPQASLRPITVVPL